MHRGLLLFTKLNFRSQLIHNQKMNKFSANMNKNSSKVHQMCVYLSDGLCYNMRVINRGGHRDDKEANQRILYHMEVQRPHFTRVRL